VLHDPRDPELITHSQLDMLRQRVYAIVQGYEDLNDHTQLRRDTLLQSMLDRDMPLASAPTCRQLFRGDRCSGLFGNRRAEPQTYTSLLTGLGLLRCFIRRHASQRVRPDR
jgi:hypothetical protein